jgi:PAS domain S-box-containing protein
MFEYIKIKTKLLLPLSILILIVLLLTASSISKQYTNGKILYELQDDIFLATHISKLVNSLQIERGLSSGYVANSGTKFKNNLLKQRSNSDKLSNKLKQFIKTIKNQLLHTQLKTIIVQINNLQNQRKLIDNLKISVDKTIDIYSKLNDKLINIVLQITKISKIPTITKNIISYSSFLYLKENSGLERATGTAIASSNKYSNKMFVEFSKLIAKQDVYSKNFFEYASDSSKQYFKTIYHNKAIENVDKIRGKILSNLKFEDLNIDPEYWFKNISIKIDILHKIELFLEKEILSNIKQELDSTYSKLWLYLIFNIISILIFLLMIILVTKLIKSEQRSRKLIDKYIISSTTDLKGKITEVSDAFCTISGYTREELIGKPHNIIRHPDMPKSAFKDLWQTIQSGKTWNGRVKNLKKDGGYYWVYANVEPLFDKKGKIEAYAAVRLDITDSIHLKDELERSKKKDKTLLQQSKLAQMGEMISMIAHQWRQPLTAISATSSDLHLKNILDNYDKEYFNQQLEKIDDLSQHLSKTIDDFRNFYKEDNNKEDVLYSDIVNGALQIVSISLQEKNISIKTNYNCKTKINTLPNELRQVILNLIKNSEDALLDKNIKDPYISIKTHEDSSYSYLEISDNAGGIPQDIIDKIFDPYFSTKTQKDGTGLGLYMSRIIIRDHSNGQLLVDNTQNGVCFTIKIPINQKDTNV